MTREAEFRTVRFGMSHLEKRLPTTGFPGARSPSWRIYRETMRSVVAKVMIAPGRGGKIVNLAPQVGGRGEALVLAEHKIDIIAVVPGIVNIPLWAEVDK